MNSLLPILEVIEKNVQPLTLNSIFLDDNARATDDLAGVTLTVNLAETGPGAKNLRVSNLDEVDFVLGAESLNKLEVLSLCAAFDEDAKMGLALVKGLGALTKSTSKTVVNESVLQNLL